MFIISNMDNIMYYLVIILFSVGWILLSIIRNYISTKSPISHKYLNHGRDVPIQKCFKFKGLVNNKNKYIRSYSTTSSSEDNSIKLYEDAYSMRKSIIKDNKNKSGIYKWTNKLTNDIYIGQSTSNHNNLVGELRLKNLVLRKKYPHPKDDLNNFYEWFTGLTDGEGSFNISRRNTQNFAFSYEITMHRDEDDMLNFIQKTLGIGKVFLSGNTVKFCVTRREDITIIIDIFKKYPLQSTKNLNFLSFKKAFELYVSSSKKSPELFEEISKIKANMNSLRTDFSESKSRKLSITPNWVLGFVEGEGSFTIIKRDYTLAFIITQSAKDLYLMKEVKNFFLSLCNDQFNGKYVSEGVRLYRDTKSNTDAVYVSISREDIITKVIIPFFDSLSWHSKKEKDYQDWKIVLRLKQLGLHYIDEGVRVINLILNQMNLKRLSSSKLINVDRESLNKSIKDLLNGPSNIETLEDGRIFVKSLNRYFNSAARDKIKVEVRDDNGLTVNTFDSITSCAKYYNISRSSLQWKLKNNKPVTINVNSVSYRVFITTQAEEKITLDYDTKSKEDPTTLYPSPKTKDEVNSSRFTLLSYLSQEHSRVFSPKKLHSYQKEISALIQSPIYVWEKCSKEGFKVIGCFWSAKKIAHFLGTNSNTILNLKNSGKIYKDRYKFT